MKVNIRIRLLPFLHFGCFVRTEVVQNDVQLLVPWCLAAHPVDKGQKLAAAGLRTDYADDGPVQDVVGGIEGDRAVAPVVVGATPAVPGIQRKPRLGSVQSYSRLIAVAE